MYEDLLLNNVRRENFYKKIKMLKTELLEIFISGDNNKKHIINVNIKMKEQFNFLLQQLKSKFAFDIIESIIFIEQDYANMKIIFSILDMETKGILKRELAEKFNIRITNTRLNEFIEWFDK